MPRSKKGVPPAYRLHSSGQARVTVRDCQGHRRDIMLGPWQSPESMVEYQRVLALLTLHHGYYPFPDDQTEISSLTVDEVILAWWKDAEKRLGPDSKELKQYRYALRPLRELYGSELAAQFTPKRLKAVRQRMIDLGWCRTVINRNIVRVRAVFSWAVSEELIPPSVAHGLREVKGLQRGDRQVREAEARPPAFWEDVVKVAPYCTRPVATMLRLQWLSGMRSGEVRVMRTLDLDRTDPDCWLYRPGSDAGPYGRHKNAWRGQERVVPLGPQCIELLTPWLREDDVGAYLFRPRMAVEDRNVLRRAQRRTPRTPSQLARKRKRKPKRPPGDCYTDTSYPQSVARACKRAGIKFNPYALRHGRKMDMTRISGSDAARAVLGQKSIDATQHYGKIDIAHAQQVMKQMG